MVALAVGRPAQATELDAGRETCVEGDRDQGQWGFRGNRIRSRCGHRLFASSGQQWTLRISARAGQSDIVGHVPLLEKPFIKIK